jgi:hypothetical protein
MMTKDSMLIKEQEPATPMNTIREAPMRERQKGSEG